MQRSHSVERLRTGEMFDMLVVGGGATGLGAAVEAATRGWRVALIERDDFAKGTSSRSTKLVHGGVRYLKQGNVSLVREALRERGRLLRNAPHLAHNMAFVIPNYRWFGGPFYAVGLKLYDAMAGSLSLGPSRWLSREKTRELLPTIETEGLASGVLYHDGQFDDARLAINLAQTAVEHGAVLANYCVCAGIVKEMGRVTGVQVRDVETGDAFIVRAKTVINATGVFVDSLREMDVPASKPIVAVSQGIHLVLPKAFMPGNAAMMIPKTADGRVLFAVPWHDCVVVGTTDTPVGDALAEPRALAEECDFVLSHARKYLAKDPTAADVLSVFAGQRPLVNTSGEGNTAKLSRDHTILVSDSGLITITGGKWTTYRKMGEDVINQAEKHAGLTSRASVTAELKIHGWTDRSGAGVYGADTEKVAALAAENAEWAERIHPAFVYTRGEVIWHARHEMARTVEDVLARRTRALLLNARASIEAAPVVAALLANELGRDAAWAARQVESYTALARRYVFTDPESRG